MSDEFKGGKLPSFYVTRRGVLAGGAALAAIGAGFRATPLRAEDAIEGPLAPWFGQGGPKAGAGLKWVHGLNLALTGAGAPIGQAMSQGAEIAADLIRASGGPDIALKLNDHQNGQVSAAVTGVRRLISQERIQSLGSSYGAATEALFPLVDTAKITTFWSGGAGPHGLGKQYVWVTMAIYAIDATPGGLGYLAKTFPDKKKLAIIGNPENGIIAVQDTAPKAWPQASEGGQVVATEMVNIGTTDFSALIARLKSANADVIYTTVYGNDQGYMIKQMREAGIAAPILIMDLVTPTVPEIAGDAIAQDVYLAVDGYQPENQNPLNQLFVTEYKKKFNVNPDYFAANFFEQTLVLWGMIRGAIASGAKPDRGPELGASVAADNKFPSVYGGGAGNVAMMSFDVKDHSITKPIGVFKVGKAGALTKVGSIKKGSVAVDPA